MRTGSTWARRRPFRPRVCCATAPPTSASHLWLQIVHRPRQQRQRGWSPCTGSISCVSFRRRYRIWVFRIAIRIWDAGTWSASRTTSCIWFPRTTEHNALPAPRKWCGILRERRRSHISGNFPFHTCPSGNERNTVAVRSARCILRRMSPGIAFHISDERRRGDTRPDTQDRRIAICIEGDTEHQRRGPSRKPRPNRPKPT